MPVIRLNVVVLPEPWPDQRHDRVALDDDISSLTAMIRHSGG